MATVNIGRIKFVWQGAYSGGSSYVPDDIVSYNGSSYVCTASTTGNLPTDTTYWSVMASKGTDGTDITSLAGLAQGDILYYDGSNWVRLGAGTAGQVLQTGGAGANPSWGTVSSDFVKIASGSVSGSASSLSIDGYYSSDYKNYRLYFIQVQCNNNQIRLRTNMGGSAETGSYYRSASDGSQNNLGSNSPARFGDWNNSYINMTNWGAQNGWGDMFIIDIFEPQSTTYHAKFQWNYSSHDTNEIHSIQGQGFYNNNASTASTGLTMFTSGNDNFTTGDWYLYGIK